MMDVAKPLSRILLACILMILLPIYLGVAALPIYWLILPATGLTILSCTIQGYRGASVIALCFASILLPLGGIYLLARITAYLL